MKITPSDNFNISSQYCIYMLLYYRVKMFHVKYFLYFIFLHLTIAVTQINFHFTNGINENGVSGLQHDCFRVTANAEDEINRQIIYYCMSELPSRLNVEKNPLFPKFTFAELSKQNITSQQLLLWSASIDVTERYQFYLDQLSSSNELTLATEVFYNCTLPRFGPVCQYEFEYHETYHSSLYEIIRDFFHTYTYYPRNLTCYTHLKCNRGPLPACLDWSEICNGRVDCLDGEFDEEHCWQFEMNECKANEYQCDNGQCIPQSFYHDDIYVPDCVDRSDGIRSSLMKDSRPNEEPSFRCEDIICDFTALTSSCVQERYDLLSEAISSIKDKSISDDCWTAFKCISGIPRSDDLFCDRLCTDGRCVEIIERTCPDMLFIPTLPVLYGHIYFAYQKNDLRFLEYGPFDIFIYAIRILVMIIILSTLQKYCSIILYVIIAIIHFMYQLTYIRYLGTRSIYYLSNVIFRNTIKYGNIIDLSILFLPYVTERICINVLRAPPGSKKDNFRQKYRF